MAAYWHGWGNEVTSSGSTGEAANHDQSESVRDLPVKNPNGEDNLILRQKHLLSTSASVRAIKSQRGWLQSRGRKL
jgi:hypothetical protein